MKAKADYLFEVSWEVCNKVGGIYTVVKSKAYLMKEFYKNYFLIGPYFEDKAKVELEQKEAPAELKHAFEKLSHEGIKCYYGSWTIDGNPNVILVDFKVLMDKKNNIKKELWELYGIDSYNSRWDFEEPMMWSWAVGKLICALEEQLPEKKVVGHFHEWLSGFAIMYLKKCNSHVKTVFTTHATMLGRSMAGSGEDLYSLLDQINPEEKAYQYGVQDKFLTERASANTADVFTTVSEITSIEAEKILGRKPDVILANGLTIRNFPTIEETSMKHLLTREKIRDFLTSFFFPYYPMKLEHNLIFFIVGRFEHKNKGLDVLISAIAKLNEKLKEENSDRTISLFIWVPMDTRGVKMEVLENKNFYSHIKNYVQLNSQIILKKLVDDLLANKDLKIENIFDGQFMKELKKDMFVFHREGNPPVSTHDLVDEHNNAVLKALKQAGLDNKQDDKVKVILQPVYLTGNDGLLNLSYYEAISGSHLGLFPSYYEPWGYTPLETAALGVASLTTDLAGFGRFIDTKIKDKKDKMRGIYVLKRFERSETEVVNDLFKIMLNFSNLSHEDRVKNKLVAKNLATEADWENFIPNYVEAHNKALDK